MRRTFALLTLAALAACGGDSKSPTEPPPPQPSKDLAATLKVGEAFTTTAAAARSLTLRGDAGSEYLLVPFFASNSGTARLPFQVAGTGVRAAAGPPTPSLGPAFEAPLFSASPAQVREHPEWESRLRERERRELAPRVAGAQAVHSAGRSGPNLALSPALQKAVGDTLIFNVNSDSICTAAKYRTGRVAAITQHAVVVADQQNPAGGYTDAEYQQLGQTFDALVWPTDTENFGEPTDIDGNGRVIIFFTSAVNNLTEEGSDSFIGGFFFARDLFPRATQTVNGVKAEGCAGSNFAEMFYLRVPDPSRSNFAKEEVQRGAVGTLGHEFQHLISASRRLYVLKAPGNNFQEASWLNEGLSHIAEELLFFRVSGLAPQQNLTRQRLVSTDAIRAAFNTYNVPNFLRYIRYLQNPDTSSLLGVDNLQTRGATWAFLRYAADRKGGNQQQTWFNLVNSTRVGVDNLNAVLGTDAVDWMQQWTASVYTDDSGVPTAPELQQPSWNYRDVIGGFRNESGAQAFPSYPLAVRDLGATAPETFNLYGGGAAFLRFGATGGDVQLRFQSGSATLTDARLRISVVRTK